MHRPTGETTRLFQLLADYYEFRVYDDFQCLLWIQPSHLVWRLNDLFTMMLHQLGKLAETCSTADNLVHNLETQLESALDELQRKDMNRMTPIVEHEVASLLPGEQPMREQRFMTVSDSERRPVFNKSFSTVEEKVHHRGHFRHATIAESVYTVDTGTPDSDQIELRPRNHQWQATIGSRRQKSEIPRIFPGTLMELERAVSRMKLYNVRTPESQAITTSSGPIGPIIARDFAHTPVTPSMCPSPATLLQLGEGLAGTRSSFIDQAKHASQAERDGGLSKDTQAIEDSNDGLSSWLHQTKAPHIRRNTSDEPASNINRGVLRHRENTI